MKKLNSFFDAVKHQNGYINNKAPFTFYEGLFEGVIPSENPEWMRIKFSGKMIPGMYHKGISETLLKHNGKTIAIPFYTPSKFNTMYVSTNPKHYEHLV